MYSYNEVLQHSLEYFQGNEFAAKVFVDKYALRKSKDQYLELTPDSSHRRLAKEFARIEAKYPNPVSEEEIYSYFINFERLIAQGSPLSGVGNPYQIQSLSNCFVIPSVGDSIGSIHLYDQRLSQIFKRRGGCGGDISNIRPAGLATNNASLTTTGIGTWMDQFSETARRIGQEGRRAAQMLTCTVHHPEILTYINIKHDEAKVTGANISIRFTDEFMHSVKNNTNYTQTWQSTENIGTNQFDISQEVSAKEVWSAFIHSNWLRGDPGSLFWDTIIRNSPADMYSKQGFKSVSTNPCSELILSSMDACRLFLTNLVYFVKNKFTSEAYFDFVDFEKTIRLGQRLMDDLVDLEIESIDSILEKINADMESPEEKMVEIDLWTRIRQTCLTGRRTGLGITSIADTMAALNLKYASEESIHLTDKIFKTLAVQSYTESINLAKERGSFPIWNYDQEIDNIFLQRIYPHLSEESKADWKKYGRRNIANLTVAPAGSISNLALVAVIGDKKYFNSTSGIEPSFLLEMDRFKKVNQGDVNAKVDKIDLTGEKWQKFTICHSGLQVWKDITGNTDITLSPYFGSTANEIDPYKKIDLISTAINWIDHSISNTTNLPESCTENEISNIYLYAYEKGLKGLTIYRDNCRQHQVLTKKNNYIKEEELFIESHAVKRPVELPCEMHHVNIKGQSWIVFVGFLSNKPYEIWGGITNDKIVIPKHIKDGKIIKTGRGKYNLQFNVSLVTDLIATFDNSTNGFHTRAISTMLRHGVPLQYIVDQIQKDDKENTLYSFNKVIGRVLKKYIKEGTTHTGQNCPNCGSTKLAFQEGCLSCVDCKFSKC